MPTLDALIEIIKFLKILTTSLFVYLNEESFLTTKLNSV